MPQTKIVFLKAPAIFPHNKIYFIGDCFHPSKRDIVLDIQKATAEYPAVIHIETNDNIKIVLKKKI